MLDNSPKLCFEFNEKEELDFYQILLQMNKLNCTYISYTLEKTNEKRINFFSDHEWLNVYHSEGFIATCQLTNLSRINGNAIIPWNTLYPSNQEEKRVIDARLDFNIANGITISQKINNTHEMIALGTTKDNKKFINVLNNHLPYLQGCLIKLRTLAIRGSYF